MRKIRELLRLKFDPNRSSALHWLRQQLVKQRTGMINQPRGLVSEFGIVIPQGRHTLAARLPGILEDAENALPDLLRAAMAQQHQWAACA